jgi:hypothetical protein
MTSDEAHNSHHPLPSKPIRGQSEADNNYSTTSLAADNNYSTTSLAADNNYSTTTPENQSFDGLYFDDDRLCSQCGQDHSHKVTGSRSILDIISFLDRRHIR